MLTTTIPAAIATVYSYLETACGAYPTLNAQATIGWPIGTVPNNWAMVGSFAQEGGGIVVSNTSQWAVIPASALRRTEEYAIAGSIVCWDGNVDPISRINDAMSLLDAFYKALFDDYKNPGNGALTPTGSWGEFTWTMPTSGPFSDADGNASGWGVVVEFELHPVNIQIATT
jgi:uncharacterized protein YciI